MPFLPHPSQNPVHIVVEVEDDHNLAVGDALFRKRLDTANNMKPEKCTKNPGNPAQFEFIGVVASDLISQRPGSAKSHFVTVTIQGLVSMRNAGSAHAELYPGSPMLNHNTNIGRVVTKQGKNSYGVMLNCGRHPNARSGANLRAGFGTTFTA